MNSHERDENLFVDGELSRVLKRWAAGVSRPGEGARQALLRRAAAWQSLERNRGWGRWRFSFGLLTPEQHRSSVSYVLMTFQTANLRLVL